LYLTVQLAARRLGVSPHTIRRWTGSGFLPCTRTAGGHRRIRKEDVDELVHLIGGNDHLAARRAREHELETLVASSIALSSELDLAPLLADIARHMTTLLDCHFCAISELDPDTRVVSVIADYDRSGRRIPDTMRYHVNQFPVAKKVLETHEGVLVNISDPRADAAETAIMLRDGDKSLLVLPMLYQGVAIGLVEVLDHVRERRYGRQELRLASALAGQSAVAVHNAKAFAHLTRADRDVRALREAVATLGGSLPRLVLAGDEAELLQSAATIACESLAAISSVAAYRGRSAGSSGVVRPAGASAAGPLAGGRAQVITSSASCGDDALTLTVTLPGEPGGGQNETLALITNAAAAALSRLA
jgi:excisionase family DNA binding protein